MCCDEYVTMATQSQRQERSFVEKREGDTLINALIGAVASVLLSFTGVGIILGGAIAGYLQNRGGGGGAKVGAISGLIAAIPAFFVITIVFGGLGLFGAGASGEVGIGAFFGGLAIFVLLFVVVILVGMGGLGGLIGGILANNNRGQPAGAGRGGYDEGWDDRGRDEYDDRGRDDRGYDDRGRDEYDDRGRGRRDEGGRDDRDRDRGRRDEGGRDDRDRGYDDEY
jgi:hypothetical protein